jgi:hypothetical protein
MAIKADRPETGEKVAAQAATPRKRGGKKDDTPYVPPEKLSKWAIWMREHGPAFEIVDMRAVMK